ncbi:MAG TPA: hypothetical protein VJA23_01890 [Candidatus Nanoarchaeia archaeon]|nr:hypothetical protein [Candidatus Nanoarchaeia archaeon]
MELLQLREKEIFETLKKIRSHSFVIIGGYAVNAYTLPRFSVDCDLVVKDFASAEKIFLGLVGQGYSKVKAELLYASQFLRLEKKMANNFKVSLDILIGEVVDRQTKARFDYAWILANSQTVKLKGKTLFEEITARVINLDALIVMKMVSCRSTDIRDVFLLLPLSKNKSQIKEEIAKRYNFQDRLNKIKEKISSQQFKNDLQGVYGLIDEIVFGKHKKAFLEWK